MRIQSVKATHRGREFQGDPKLKMDVSADPKSPKGSANKIEKWFTKFR